MLTQFQTDFSIFIIYLYYGLEFHLLFTVLYLSFGISGFFNSQKLLYFSRCVPMEFFKSNCMILFFYVYFFSCLSHFFAKYLMVLFSNTLQIPTGDCIDMLHNWKRCCYK